MNDETPIQLSFGEFWSWLIQHPNCILGVGTPEVMVHDHEDHHWILWKDESDTFNIQLFRGKQPMAEFSIMPEVVDFVRGFAGDVDGEYVFELVVVNQGEPFVSYFVVMRHGLDEMDVENRIQ